MLIIFEIVYFADNPLYFPLYMQQKDVTSCNF